MKNNKFEVDLGTLELTEDQKTAINSAIQQAVTGELAKMNLKSRLVLIPISHFPFGGITMGFIAREPNDKLLKELL
jgi:hypothetical protein